MRLILCVAGEISSGKGTFTKYVRKKYGGDSFSFSHILKKVLDVLQLKKDRKNIQKISTVLRQNFGEDILAKVIHERVKKSPSKLVVVDGVRRMTDVKYLKKIKGFCLIYLEADMKKRFERIIKRKEKADDDQKGFRAFQKDHLAETELQIKKIKKKAKFILENNGTKREFFKKIDKIINIKK